MDYRKRLIILIFIALLGLECLEAGKVFRQTSESNFYPGVIRFHVIANSNSKEDQKLKLKVRDYVMPRLEETLTACLAEFYKNKNEEHAENRSEQEMIKEYISVNLEKINEWTGECLKENGSGYEVKTELGIRAIPAKQYDDIYFPAGNYEALTIKIGKAEGENWWCVVFPPLCLIDSSGSAYNESFKVSTKDRIVIKSKVKELLTQRKQLVQKSCV